MSNCKFPSRPDWQLSPWSLFWNMSSIQHLINSTTDCLYKVVERKLSSVQCRERHAIMDSTNSTEAAVQTTVIYQMDLQNAEAMNVKLAPTELDSYLRSSIVFEYEETTTPPLRPSDSLHSEIETASKMLCDLVLDSLDEVQLSTIHQFTDLVGRLRSLPDLKPLVDRARACEFVDGAQCTEKLKDRAFSALLDALLQCNTLPCARAIAYAGDDAAPTYLDFVFRSWSYMHHSSAGFATNFNDLCSLKKSPQCYLSLGDFSRRVLSQPGNVSPEVQDEIEKVAASLHSKIVEHCHPVRGRENSRFSDCLIYLKSASNLGKHYSKLVPDGVERFLQYSCSDYLPTVVRTSALEAVKETITPEQHSLVYNALLPLLRNASLVPSIRMLAFDVLMLAFEDEPFEAALVDVLKSPRDAEVQHYVAEGLNSYFVDPEFRTNRQKFLDSLTDLLQENGLSLEKILYQTRHSKSRSTTSSMFTDLPFMPASLQRFGLKAGAKHLFDSRAYPTVSVYENMLSLVGAFVPASKLGLYFEGMEDFLLAYQKNVAHMNLKAPSLVDLYEALMKTFKEYKTLDDIFPNFNDTIHLNIRKIHDLYWQHHKQFDPYVKAYFDLFGSTVKYAIQDSLKQTLLGQDLFRMMRFVKNNFEDEVDFDSFRLVRFLEGCHQVPTVMGLPLNWTTSAALAFSVQGGLKYSYSLGERHFHAKGFLKPSFALTFLNRMVLDFPTLTQVGVQANSSGYSSTDLRIQLNSGNGKHSFRLMRPAKTQKVFEMFQTNHLLKHDRCEEIADQDVQRASASWCAKFDAGGVDFCWSRSYPNVTHREMPWAALIAGSSKWQFLVVPKSQENAHYDVQAQFIERQKASEYTARMGVTVESQEKSLNFKMVVDDDGKSVAADLRTSEASDFMATLDASRHSNGLKAAGEKVEARLQLSKDFKYEMVYSNEVRREFSNQTADDNGSGEEDTSIRYSESKFFLSTPHDEYSFIHSSRRHGENEKTEVTAEYRNHNSSNVWMRNLLPQSTWADEKKASVRGLLHWKTPRHLADEDAVFRQTEFRFLLPRQTISLLADALQGDSRQQINFRLAKTNHESESLESFLNFTYDSWTMEDGGDGSREIRRLNLTVPRRSWALDFQRVVSGPTMKHELRLRKSKMVGKSYTETDYVGWWKNEASDLFDLQEHEIKLTADLAMQGMTAEQLQEKYPQEIKVELRDFTNFVLDAHVAVHYPFYDKEEKVVLDGFFIMSRGNKLSRYQKTFDLTSSYNNLKLSSDSVYEVGAEGSTLYHQSHFTYLPTQAKAYNTIHYKSVTPVGKCHQVFFDHAVRSSVFDLSTEASYECDAEDDKLYTLLLQLRSNSSKWEMLTMSIDQIIEDLSPEFRREDMTLSHPLGTVHTDAMWKGKHRDLQKQFTVCSKEGNCPNAELHIESSHLGREEWTLKLPNQNNTRVTFQRWLSPNFKRMHVKFGHSDSESEVPVDFLDLEGEILAPQFHVWKGVVDSRIASKVLNLFQSAYRVAEEAVVSASKDEKHPVNDMLQPYLKMTLFDYWNSVTCQVKEFFSVGWKEIKETFFTLEAFTDPVMPLLCNAAVNVRDFFSSAYSQLQEKTFTVWALAYFNVPTYLKEGLLYLPRGLLSIAKQLTPQEDHVLHFKFFTGKFVELDSFREWPSFAYDPTSLWSGTFHQPFFLDSAGSAPKVALIFGPRHVYTFDGRLYGVPPYPSNGCALLLAYDVHASLFAVLSTETGIHLLFPELRVTVDGQDAVYVNGSGIPSDLPVQSTNGKVTVKRGSTTVEIWSPSLTVICSGRHFLCLLKLQNFHEGGVVGLLGNADYRSDNDFLLPNGSVATSLRDFVSQYELSGGAECRNFDSSAARTEPSPDPTRVCQEKFSNLCWQRPELRDKFLQACADDAREGLGPCYAETGLAALCHFQQVPAFTICHTPKQESSRIGRKLQVVLVVQESKYLASSGPSSAPLDGLQSLLTSIDVQFREKGYDSVQYSLVAYGGQGVHFTPSVRSRSKFIWLSLKNMTGDVLKTLDFKGTEGADGVQALKYALDELGFETFDSKIAIVVAAKDKQFSKRSLTSTVQATLEENGITLYTVSSYPSVEKGADVFGVRADGRAILSPPQSADDTYLDFPRGGLAKLSSASKGSVFFSKFLVDNGPSAFFNAVAEDMLSKVAGESGKCRQCGYEPGKWWWYSQKCSIVDC